MIRLQDNTPSIYCEKSRDFQLFCRLYDCVNNNVKFNIDSITNINLPDKIDENLLELLAVKVGFFPKQHYNNKILRSIIEAFPYILKYKGSKKAIIEAVTCLLKAEDISNNIEVITDNHNYSISIYTEKYLQNTEALDNLLEYILPVGYTYELGLFEALRDNTEITTTDSTALYTGYVSSLSQVIGSDRMRNRQGGSDDFDFTTATAAYYTGNIITGEIVGSNNLAFIKDEIIDTDISNYTDVDYTSTTHNKSREDIDLPDYFDKHPDAIYNITYNLDGFTSLSNNQSQIDSETAYNSQINFEPLYTLDQINIKMNNQDITNDAYYTELGQGIGMPNTHHIRIEEVTGDIIITITSKSSSIGPFGPFTPTDPSVIG